MKKLIPLVLAVIVCVTCVACGARDYVLNEKTFFLVMTNIQARPEQYLDSTLEFDCFTYKLKDVDGTEYMCGVRKCSSGYGCVCGNDTIIGFVLEYDGELPEPYKQSEDTNEKTWVHLTGKIKRAESATTKSVEKIDVEIHSYVNGEIDPNTTEHIVLVVLVVESCEIIDDYSELSYYVTK